ncbi:hypothetical protein EYF80_004211 [Liparis tanakae]|uniref:Uncharacterized protein n=1 Tax=Liparis tanakae TaxID=230148 RepID=A0A4Z2J7B9_9TELE|nr:hypothetical protein EYF80_004211 [Liparis tanakae]
MPVAGVRAVRHGVHGEGVGAHRGALYRVRNKHNARGCVRPQEPLREPGSEDLIQSAPRAPLRAGHQRPWPHILTDVNCVTTHQQDQFTPPQNPQQIPFNEPESEHSCGKGDKKRGAVSVYKTTMGQDGETTERVYRQKHGKDSIDLQHRGEAAGKEVKRGIDRRTDDEKNGSRNVGRKAI